MAFTSVASLSFNARGSSWTADFEVRNASSANNTLHLLSGTRQVGDRKIHPFNPILPATLEVEVFDKGRTIHDYILNNSNNDIALTVKKGGTIWHTGTLDRVRGGDAIGHSDPKLTLVFDDGLPLLRDSSIDGLTGRETLLDYLGELTNRTNMGIPLRVALAWAHNDTDTSSNRRSQSWQIDIEHQNSGSVWDALVEVLTEYNLQLWQQDGKWRVLHRSYRDSTMDWEERNTSGSVTTGSRDPIVTLSDADWKEKDEPVRRPDIPPQGWKQEYEFFFRDWINGDLTSEDETLKNANTWPEAWRIVNVTYDTGADQIKIDASNYGINKSDYGFGEQIFSRVMAQDEVRSEEDSLQMEISGSIEHNLPSGDSVDVPIVEIAAIKADGTQVTHAGGSSWGSNNYNKTTVTGDGTSTDSFTESINVPAPDNSSTSDAWMYRVRLVTEEDPDNDGFPEIVEARFDSAKIDKVSRDVKDDKRPFESGVVYEMSVGNQMQTEQSGIGMATEKNDDFLKEDITHPFCAIRHLNLNGDWTLLDRADVEHATRALLDPFGIVRLQDRYAQHSRNIFRIIGHMDASALGFDETADYKSSKWVPYFVEEAINDKQRKVEVMELRDDSVPTGVVNFMEA